MTSIEGFKSSPYITLEEITNALEKFDPTEDGRVPYKSLKIVMRDLGLDPRESEVSKSIETLKTNGKHAERLTHFTAESLFELLSNRKTKENDLEEIRTAFKLFDVKGKGYITVSDLKHITGELKETVKDDELAAIVGNKVPGRVSFEEFAVIMKKTSLY
uniref:EF-hand domain-containing protein n=1 Tax=Panagrolaimus sp. JU765 TaxID=591449 RepID=A0AC34RIN5_9BILA